jgi:hypothetical protein
MEVLAVPVDLIPALPKSSLFCSVVVRITNLIMAEVE